MPDKQHEDHPLCVVLGGGGHARVLIDCLQMRGDVALHGVLDRDATRYGASIYGVPIVGPDETLPALIKSGVNSFVVGLGSLGDARQRIALFEFGLTHGLKPMTVIHPRAMVSAHTLLGRGVQVLPGAIINAGAQIGENVIINSGAIIEHDCIIADHVHVASGAMLSGAVTVGTGAHIGAGATIRQNITVGQGAVVGIGAAVVRDVPANTTVIGVPARPI